MLSLQRTSPLKFTVYVMDGCGACHNYLPRLQRIYRQLERQGYCMPELEILDLNDPKTTRMADYHGIKYTPSTVVQRPSTGHWKKFEHELDDVTIERLLHKAASRCEV